MIRSGDTDNLEIIPCQHRRWGRARASGLMGGASPRQRLQFIHD